MNDLQQKALAEVNEIRKLLRAEPLDELPIGTHDACDCPIANALQRNVANIIGVSVTHDTISIYPAKGHEYEVAEALFDYLDANAIDWQNFHTEPVFTAVVKLIFAKEHPLAKFVVGFDTGDFPELEDQAVRLDYLDALIAEGEAEPVEPVCYAIDIQEEVAA